MTNIVGFTTPNGTYEDRKLRAKTLLNALKRIRDKGPYNRVAGICCNLKNFDFEMEFRDVCVAWPKHSGNLCFPIPSPTGRDPGDMYLFSGEDVMWNKEHPYGALRYEMLNWAIEQLEAQ